MRNLTFAAFAALTLASAPVAANDIEAFELRIDHSDLDLASAADEAQLRERIRTAVRKACTAPQSSAADDLAFDRFCYERTMKEALVKVENKKSRQLALAKA